MSFAKYGWICQGNWSKNLWSDHPFRSLKNLFGDMSWLVKLLKENFNWLITRKAYYDALRAYLLSTFLLIWRFSLRSPLYGKSQRFTQNFITNKPEPYWLLRAPRSMSYLALPESPMYLMVSDRLQVFSFKLIPLILDRCSGISGLKTVLEQNFLSVIKVYSLRC